MFALIKNGIFVREILEGSRFEIDGNPVMPAIEGQLQGGHSLHKIFPAEPVPEGKVVVGTSVELDGGQWTYVHILEDEHVITPEELRAQMEPISKRQLRLTLVRNGISLSELDTAILTMGDEAVIEWQDASEYRRLHPLLNQVADYLALTQEQVDVMWEQALSA